MPSILELRDEPLITDDDPISKGDGHHVVREESDEITIYADVKDGIITGFSARRNEEGLKVVHVSVGDVLIDGEFAPIETYLCYTHDNKTVCYKR